MVIKRISPELNNVLKKLKLKINKQTGLDLSEVKISKTIKIYLKFDKIKLIFIYQFIRTIL